MSFDDRSSSVSVNNNNRHHSLPCFRRKDTHSNLLKTVKLNKLHLGNIDSESDVSQNDIETVTVVSGSGMENKRDFLTFNFKNKLFD